MTNGSRVVNLAQGNWKEILLEMDALGSALKEKTAHLEDRLDARKAPEEKQSETR